MQMQNAFPKSYVLLPSGTLVVEPNPGLLASRALLLAAAEDYVAIVESSVPPAKYEGVHVNMAVLSHSLGKKLLASLTANVRTHWPHARILIIGNAMEYLDESRYDIAIGEHCRPEVLLETLYQLSRGIGIPRGPADHRVLFLAAGKRVRYVRASSESDPSKRLESVAGDVRSAHDLPAGEHAVGLY
ncbi:hypothetical protein SAMN05421771_3352 [Granulicella pectinivorans]|uniref:Uncharacterized protein n=1 Tax=Granulicella pectinivorans TaxID=474950 RepID=A0A1I6MR95_9BACT|nr:hypothetical protein [Granulicella pectinivorans]SFS18127.1 hypothetical protein SAMN05421771_3352 [Granulicella pectinivorans]